MKPKIFPILSKLFVFLLTAVSLIPVITNKTYADSQFLYWPQPANKSIACGIGCYPGHNGIDIGVSTNNSTPIYAAAGGVVTNVVRDQPYGYNRNINVTGGNYVFINHENGYTTRYLHMTQSIQVNVGQRVNPGSILGYGSNSGLTCGNDQAATGCMGSPGSYYHLHFEVRYNGNPVNPFTNNLWVKNLNDGSIANPPDFHPFDKNTRTGQFVGLGKCMDLRGADQTNGNLIILYDCGNNNSAQLWMYEPSTKLLRLENNRGQCIEISGNNTNNGSGINIWECLGTTKQRWNVTPQGEFKSDLDINKCIDIAGGNSASGTRLQLYDCNGSAAQKWTPSANPVTSLNGLCMDDRGGVLNSGDTIQSYNCNGSRAQKWFYNQSTQEIKSINGKCIDRDGGNTYDGTRIQLFDCNGSIAQKWRLEGGNIKDIQSGKCIDGDSLTSGTRIQLWTCYGGFNQNWNWR